MKMLYAAAAVFFCLSISSMASGGKKALTFSDCCRLALERSETLAIDQQLINAAKARFIQARGTLFPVISFESLNSRAETSGGGESNESYGDNTQERKFKFSQPLFNGFKEFAGIHKSRMLKTQREHEKERARQLLIAEVADAFFICLQQKQILKTLDTIKEALHRRIADLMQREELGRSRRSEVVNAQAQLFGVEAEIEQVKSANIAAKELLDYLTGEDTGELGEEQDACQTLKAGEYYEEQAELRPDIIAAKNIWESASQDVKIARGQWYPSVSLDGNYYTERDSSAEDVDWDISLKVTMPLFEGLRTYGAVVEARFIESQKELEFLMAKRLARTQVRTAYEQYCAAISRTAALKKAYDSASLNYKLQEEDYGRSLVSNLDVLDAIRQMQNAQRDYIQSLYDTKRLRWHLFTAAGIAWTEPVE